MKKSANSFSPIGIYFRSNHERLLDELSRAITIISHSLEQIVRDKGTLVLSSKSNDHLNGEEKRVKRMANDSSHYFEGATRDSSMKRGLRSIDRSSSINHLDRPISANRTELNEHYYPTMNRSILEDFQNSLSAHSKCYGSPDNLSKKRGDYLYE